MRCLCSRRRNPVTAKPRVGKTCETCGGAFTVPPYRSETARFCSRSCRGTWVGRQPHNKGAKPHMVGNKFRVGLPPWNAGRPGKVGEANPNWKASINLRCEHCGSTFQRKPNEVRGRRGTRFCSRACFETSGCFEGAKSPTHRPKDAAAGRKAFTAESQRWRRDVFTRDNFTCQKCGQRGGRLHAHHIKPWANYPELRFAAENGQTVCVPCHRAIHKQHIPVRVPRAAPLLDLIKGLASAL